MAIRNPVDETDGGKTGQSSWISMVLESNIENVLDTNDSELRSKHVVLVGRQCDSVVPDTMGTK